MAITLHVDLDQTDMYDFIEHFERGLHVAIRDFIDDAPHWTWTGPNPWVVWDDEPFNPPDGAARHVIRIRRQAEGSTKQTYILTRESSESSGEKILFMLTIVRYRRDRLKVILAEFGEEGVYAPRMLTWIKERWGEQVPLPVESVARSEAKAMSEREQSRIKAHADAIKRLDAGEHKTANLNKWKVEYHAETGIDPDTKVSGAAELYRVNVWRKRKRGGKT